MQTTIIRIKIQEGKQMEFEAAAAEQMENCRGEPGTVLYTFFRTPDPTEYVHIMAYADEESFAQHVTRERLKWTPALQAVLARPNERERYAPPDVVAWLSRDVSEWAS